MPDAPEIKTIFTVDLSQYVDGLQTMLTMTETTGKQLQGLLTVQAKQPDFSGLQTQLDGINKRTADYLSEQAQLPPVLAAGSDGLNKFGGSNDSAGAKVEGHTLKMRGLKRESRESFQAIAFLAISISSLAASAGDGDTKLSKMSQTMGQGISAGFGLASMLVALEVATGPVAIVIGAVVAIGFALGKILSDDTDKANALKAAMADFDSSLKNASLGSLEEYRKNLVKLKEDSDAHLKTLKAQEVAFIDSDEYASGASKAVVDLNDSINNATLTNKVYAETLAKVDAQIKERQINFVDAQKFSQESLTAATVSEFEKRRKVAEQTWTEEQDKYKGHNDALYAAKVKYWAEMKKIAGDERSFNQQLAEQDFNQQISKIKEQGAKRGEASDAIDLAVMAAQRQHYQQEYNTILAITGALSNEQILKKKELETKLTEIEAAEEEKRIAHKRKVQTEIDDLANKDLEIQIAKLSLQGMKQSKTQEQIDAAILKQRKLTNDAEIKSNEDKFGRGEIDAAAFFKKDAELQTKDTQLTEEQLKATIKAEDEKKQKQKQALDDFGANLEEAGKLSAAAFVASKAYNIANATISTYYGAQEAYSALAGIPVVGPELGIAAAAAAIVAGVARVDEIAKQSPTGFAFGGEASTPTLALLGEGSDTDIIAPKRDFIQVWREDLMPVALKDMRSAPQQGPGSSSTSDPVVAALKKEFAALKKTIVNNTPVTMISSDTDYHRYQKTVDRAARIKKMRLL
jgi:hypothetical protein